MNILAIDTTAMQMSVALAYKNALRGYTRSIRVGAYETIMCVIAHVLRKAHASLDRIDCFGVSVGPGSFTGIRIGMSTIKGFAYACRKPIIGFRSLDAVAWRYRHRINSGMLCVLRDARRQNVYSATFQRTGSLLQSSPYVLAPAIDVLRDLQQRYRRISRKSGALYVCGDGVDVYRDLILNRCPHAVILTKQQALSAPRALIDLTRYTKKARSVHTIMPFYMYPKDCQVRKAGQ